MKKVLISFLTISILLISTSNYKVDAGEGDSGRPDSFEEQM